MQRAEKRALKYAKLYKEQRDAARKHASRYKMERDEALAAAAKAQKQCDEALAEEESSQASDAEDFLDWLGETEGEWDAERAAAAAAAVAGGVVVAADGAAADGDSSSSDDDGGGGFADDGAVADGDSSSSDDGDEGGSDDGSGFGRKRRREGSVMESSDDEGGSDDGSGCGRKRRRVGSVKESSDDEVDAMSVDEQSKGVVRRHQAQVGRRFDGKRVNIHLGMCDTMEERLEKEQNARLETDGYDLDQYKAYKAMVTSERRKRMTSHWNGVWKRKWDMEKKWAAKYCDVYVGVYGTEREAACAYNNSVRRAVADGKLSEATAKEKYNRDENGAVLL